MQNTDFLLYPQFLVIQRSQIPKIWTLPIAGTFHLLNPKPHQFARLTPRWTVSGRLVEILHSMQR